MGGVEVSVSVLEARTLRITCWASRTTVHGARNSSKSSAARNIAQAAPGDCVAEGQFALVVRMDQE